MAVDSDQGLSSRAIVSHKPVDGNANWKLEDVVVREVQPTELLVRIVATGICHSDLVMSTWPKEAIPYPKILGHEG